MFGSSIFFFSPGTGFKVSLTTGAMSRVRIVVRWWVAARVAGMMSTATSRGNTSASMPTVSPLSAFCCNTAAARRCSPNTKKTGLSRFCILLRNLPLVSVTDFEEHKQIKLAWQHRGNGCKSIQMPFWLLNFHHLARQIPQNVLSANPGPQCDLSNGWDRYSSNCYKLKSGTAKSWSAARHDCIMEGGDLVSITSEREELYVTGLLDPFRIDLWIGLSNLVRQNRLQPRQLCQVMD